RKKNGTKKKENQQVLSGEVSPEPPLIALNQLQGRFGNVVSDMCHRHSVLFSFLCFVSFLF
ncbi:MAG: hypothetical protein WC197_08175, partial [Candidatus Gastranaerophilaceae bacterium]